MSINIKHKHIYNNRIFNEEASAGKAINRRIQFDNNIKEENKQEIPNNNNNKSDEEKQGSGDSKYNICK
jgi:hypothetical protein